VKKNESCSICGDSSFSYKAQVLTFYRIIFTFVRLLWATLGRISLVLTLLGLFHLIVISYHLVIFTSFTHALFSWIRFYKCLRISLSLICSTFVSTLNQLHSIRLFIHSPHLISFHFSVYSSHLYFSWSKKLKLKPCR
jgi:hypothetical protein